MKQYKLVAGPTTSQFLSKNGSNDDAVKSFQTVIDQNAAAGWRYHSMEPISTTQTKGCIFKQTIVSTFYMLVFEKDV